LYSKDNTSIQTGLSGDTQIIQLISPTANQTVTPGSTITVSGTVAKGFENQTLQVTLFSGDQKPSNVLRVQNFIVDRDGRFRGTFTEPSSLPPRGTKMQFWLELLEKG
jgi:hypothetical protein